MNGIWIFPCVVAACILAMLVFLARDWYRQWRCSHRNVRLVRQQRGETVYFAEVCMDCRKASRARP